MKGKESSRSLSAMLSIALLSLSAFSPRAPLAMRGVSALGMRGLRAAPLAMGLAELNDQGVVYKVQKSEADWRSQLSDEEYNILRQKGTEYPGSGKYNKYYPKEGHFVCAGCGTALYSAQSKFDSGCGWPAFDKIVQGSVVTKTDNSLGMSRVEIMCAGCGGHLGHVFEGEGFTPTMERHCVNSASVKYVDVPLPDGTVEEKILPAYQSPKDKAKSILGNLFGKD